MVLGKLSSKLLTMNLEEYKASKYYRRVLDIISSCSSTLERIEKLAFRNTDISYDFTSKAEIGTLVFSEEDKKLYIFLGNMAKTETAVYLVI